MECKKIVIVFKTHFDIGFTDLAQNVLESYSKDLMPTVVSACREAREKNPGYPYVWTMSSWPLKEILESEKTEEQVVREAEKLIENDELVWHMLPYTTHTEFCGTEEFIRGMYNSKRLCDKYGKHFVSAKMTDVPGHTRALPAILDKAGVKFLHLGCNPGCMPPDVPRLFYWKSQDESKVLTFYNKGGYGSSILPPEDWDFPVWLAVMQTNDNLGPHKPEAVTEFIRQAREVYPEVEVKIGSLDDFYNELSRYDLDAIPVVTGDLADTWIHGVGAYPKEVSGVRNSRQMTDEIQKLTAIYGDDTKPADNVLERCYENSLLFGEHTWGLDVKITLGMDRYYKKKEFLEHLSDEPCQRIEESWEEQRNRERISTGLIQTLAAEQIGHLAEMVDDENPHVTVFNGLGFQRDGWAVISGGISDQETTSLIDPRNGKTLRVINEDGQKKVWVNDLPALGYLTLDLCSGTCEEQNSAGEAAAIWDQERGILENKHFRLRFDLETGTIRSLTDRRTGKEWVDQNSGGLGQYRYDIYGSEDVTEYIRSYVYRFYDWLINDLGRMNYPEQKHLTYLPEKARFEAERVGNGIKVLITYHNDVESWRSYGNSPETVLEVKLYDEEDAIDMKVILLNKQETPFIESGHILFPFAAEDQAVTMNKMGQVLDIAEDIVKDGNHAIYCCENWIDVTSGDECATLICKDSPLNSVGESGIYKFYPEYRKMEPVIYNNLFNNMWGTNFPQWLGGNLEYSYRLVFGRKTVAEKNKSAHSFTSPLLAGYGDGKCSWKRFSPCSDWLKTAGDVQVLTVKPAEDGKGLILRIIDIAGSKRKEMLTFHMPWDEIWECSALEEKQSCVARKTDNVEFELSPYEIKTFFLK